MLLSEIQILDPGWKISVLLHYLVGDQKCEHRPLDLHIGNGNGLLFRGLLSLISFVSQYYIFFMLNSGLTQKDQS